MMSEIMFLSNDVADQITILGDLEQDKVENH